MNAEQKIRILSSTLLLTLWSASSFAEMTDQTKDITSNKVSNDNTKVNQRDRLEQEVTADQQGLNKRDSEITRLIRRELIQDRGLSTYAHNIKIITADGNVTLKGPVRSRAEVDRIVSSARSVAGVLNVKNEMAVAPINPMKRR